MNDVLRTTAERQMARNIPQAVWGYVEKQGWAGSVRKGERDLNWLTDKVWEVLDLKGELRERAGGVTEPRTRALRGDVQAAISRVVVAAASRREDVREFRKSVLGDRLLRLDDVKEWITAQAKLDGRATGWLRVPLPDGVNPFRDESALIPLKGQSVGLSTETLVYAVAGSDWMHHIAVRHDGVLGRLRHLSRTLAKDYEWDEAQATTFALTGLIPLIASVRSRAVPQAIHFRDPSNAYGRGRLVLDVDPAITPQELTAYYQKIRRQLMGGSRMKRLSPKHLALALFEAERADHADGRSLLKAWNKAHPDDAYPHEGLANFRRDCRVALERLLTPRISSMQAMEWATKQEDKVQRTTNDGTKKSTKKPSTRTR